MFFFLHFLFSHSAVGDLRCAKLTIKAVKLIYYNVFALHWLTERVKIASMANATKCKKRRQTEKKKFKIKKQLDITHHGDALYGINSCHSRPLSVRFHVKLTLSLSMNIIIIIHYVFVLWTLFIYLCIFFCCLRSLVSWESARACDNNEK